MEKEKIINKLTEEHNKLINQLEESECPLMSEIVLQGVNRTKALDWGINLLNINNVDLDNERNKLSTFLKEGSLQAMPIDLLQVVHRHCL